jgi:hypothetical protein
VSVLYERICACVSVHVCGCEYVFVDLCIYTGVWVHTQLCIAMSLIAYFYKCGICGDVYVCWLE